MATKGTAWAIRVTDTLSDREDAGYTAYVCNDGECAEAVRDDARGDPRGATAWSRPLKIDVSEIPDDVTGCWACPHRFVDEDADRDTD